MNLLSMLFGAGVTLRNTLYDRGACKVHRLTRPVVSIGNISVGGSGKTPFVIAFAELLQKSGIEFDVLSRGYGRSSAGIAVVDPEGSPEQFGDEPLLIARKLRVPVIVGADRYQAGLLAEKQFSTRLHLLDDGFQHRRLHRDFDIVLLPRDDLSGTLLPVGRLREPLSALRRADAIAVFEGSGRPAVNTPVWAAQRLVTLSDIGGKAVAFCGIARPRQFFLAIKDLGQETVAEIAFPDHHRYREPGIDRLLRLKTSTGADRFITTEKDLINLGALAARLQPLRAAAVQIMLESPEQALKLVLETIEQRSGFRL
jgi:tetraacyldisaccharide 4'-kinase